MRITHLGGEKTVTGSCHLVQANGLNILIDCGQTQGKDNALPLGSWPLPVSEIDFVFVTHAHVDHIGRLPELIAAGFEGEIICTHPTKALLRPMLRDAMVLSGAGRETVRRINGIVDDASWGFEYGRDFYLGKGVSFSLGRAGHILGSCFVRLVVDERPVSVTVVFSGDLGNKGTPLLPDPDPLPGCDLLVMESTYGDRLHPDRAHRRADLARVLERALSDGGKVFIPAFSLGRTQEILFDLDRLFVDDGWRKNLSPPVNESVPVFIDSPLGLKITDIYNSLSRFWDDEARALLARRDNPIDFERLFAVARYREHRQLLDIPGPAIIIAGSGMCSGGRIVDHLAEGLAKPENDVVFVGYQAGGTLGRDILKYGRRRGGYVYIDNRKVLIKAGVHNLSGYSAHADQQGLFEWVASADTMPEKIKLVHGETAARKALAARLASKGCPVDW